MAKELQDMDSAKVQMTTWIRFMIEVEDENRSFVRVDMLDKTFNSQMMEVSREET